PATRSPASSPGSTWSSRASSRSTSGGPGPAASPSPTSRAGRRRSTARSAASPDMTGAEGTEPEQAGPPAAGADAGTPAGAGEGPPVARERSGPLAGVTVVELAGLGALPFGSQKLGDMGADIIRVHRPSDVPTEPPPP